MGREYEEFSSELGKVAVSKDHLERERSSSEEWKEIEENFGSDQILDKIHFSEIQELEIQPETMRPYIKVKTDGDWKKLFFKNEEVAEECFTRFRYNYRAFKQNYEN
ncbi:MAG: hypothetical protein ABEJ83_02880 [Candidatus Nanohaloarchaea archaeon]